MSENICKFKKTEKSWDKIWSEKCFVCTFAVAKPVGQVFCGFPRKSPLEICGISKKSVALQSVPPARGEKRTMK